jgi:CHAD domain-containing protein
VRNGSREFILAGDAGAVPEALRIAAVAAGGGLSVANGGTPSRVRRTWLDTFDWRLYRAGLTLQQAGARGRDELVLTGRDGDEIATQKITPGSTPKWPSLLAELPPGPLRERLEPVVGVRALSPVARAVSLLGEQRVLNADAKTIARVAVDRMSVSYPARAGAPPRLSVWPVRGYQAQAGKISDALAGAPGVRQGGTSDLDLALAAAGRGPAVSAAIQLSADMPAATALAAILAALLDSIEENVPGAIRDIDTEFLHDLRVAVRRTRSALKLAGRALPGGMAAGFRPEFSWLGDLTTPARDLDVFLLGFPDMAAGLIAATEDDLTPFREHIASAREAAHRDLRRGLRSARFRRLTGQWRAALADVRPPARRPAVGDLASARIEVARRRALRAGQRITPASPSDSLHELRKRCKELRYLVEMFGSLYDSQERWRAVRELKALQDCLGAFQDAEVQQAGLRAFAGRMLADRSAPAATFLAMGEVTADLASRQRRARSEFDGRFAAFASAASQARLSAMTKATAA